MVYDRIARSFHGIAARGLWGLPMVLLVAMLFEPGTARAVGHGDSIPGEPVRMLNITAGEIGVADDIALPRSYGLELNLKPHGRWRLIPALGISRAENGASYVYGAVNREFWLSERWLLIPSFGIGSFEDSEEIQLGKTLEFRSSVEIAYRVYDRVRLGLGVYHLSNGGLAAQNPGTESLVFSLYIPLASE